MMKKTNRKCSMCGAVGHWLGMHYERKIDHWQHFKHEGIDTYYEVQHSSILSSGAVGFKINMRPEVAIQKTVADHHLFMTCCRG